MAGIVLVCLKPNVIETVTPLEACQILLTTD
jgi:hypothetical protein